MHLFDTPRSLAYTSDTVNVKHNSGLSWERNAFSGSKKPTCHWCEEAVDVWALPRRRQRVLRASVRQFPEAGDQREHVVLLAVLAGANSGMRQRIPGEAALPR